jgi:hypothetical protein
MLVQGKCPNKNYFFKNIDYIQFMTNNLIINDIPNF